MIFIILFNRHIKKDKKQLDEQTVKGKEEYIQSQRIEENILNYHYRVGSITKENNLPDLIYNLDVSYLLNKLHFRAAALTLKIVSHGKIYNFSSIEHLTELMDMSQYARHPLITLYRNAIALIEIGEDDTYSRFLILLEEYSDIISTEILRHFYGIAINYCVSKMWTNRVAYAQKMFNLFNIMHDKKLLIDDGFIPIGRFKNMVGVGCFVEAFDWVEEIVEHYRPFIRKEVRESVCHFNYGAVAFHQKDYEVAHDRFIQVDKINTVYDTNTRVLILKCLYEKEKDYNEYTMTAFRSADSFFKTNKQLPQRSKTGYRNFITILMTLYRIRHREGARTVEWAAEQLAEQEVNSDKRWLLEKIEELKGRKKRSW